MTVDEYLAAAPEPQRSTLEMVRHRLRALLPEAEETISYGVPAFKFGGKAVAGFAYFTGHCSYFPHSGVTLATLAAELDDYRWSKGTLKFPVDDPLPEALLRRLVVTRLAELDR
jgi:uncharacterized protein YdhG (YjbR/CyaY superfamily)